MKKKLAWTRAEQIGSGFGKVGLHKPMKDFAEYVYKMLKRDGTTFKRWQNI